jgi:hypothetical protein
MMVQNGAKLERELAVYAVIPKLIPFFTDAATCALVQNVPMSWYGAVGSAPSVVLLLLRLSEHIPYSKRFPIEKEEKKKADKYRVGCASFL